MNSRFAVSVHILTVLASRMGQLPTSETIAEQVNTNPAVVRRLVGALQKAGLVTSKLGPGGGLSLARALTQKLSAPQPASKLLIWVPQTYFGLRFCFGSSLYLD